MVQFLVIPANMYTVKYRKANRLVPKTSVIIIIVYNILLINYFKRRTNMFP